MHQELYVSRQGLNNYFIERGTSMVGSVTARELLLLLDWLREREHRLEQEALAEQRRNGGNSSQE